MKILASTLLVAGLFTTTWSHAAITVIVNPKSSLAAMTAEQVSDLFMGVAALPNGRPPKLLDQRGPIREEFYEKVAGRKLHQVKAAWARIVFTGKQLPPTELPSAADVKKFVAEHPDAIGYIASSDVDSSVKGIFAIQ